MLRRVGVIAFVVGMALGMSCSKSVMPEGFGKLKLGMSLEKLLDTVASDPAWKDNVNYRTTIGPKTFEGKLPNSKEGMLAELERKRADFETMVRNDRAAIPARWYSANTASTDMFKIVVRPAGVFKSLAITIEEQAVDRVSFEINERTEQAYQGLVSQAATKFGARGREEKDSRYGCESATTTWIRCGDLVDYKVDRIECDDRSGGVEVRITRAFENDCKSRPKISL